VSVPPWWGFFLLSLASFRLWKIIGDDEILAKPRDWVLKRMPNDKLELLIVCPWCMGFYISGLATLLYCLTTGWLDWFGFGVTWLAISAVVGILAHYTVED
jgi:hypothetical protein